MATAHFVLLVWAVVPILSYPYFESHIPNGQMVPHPCKPSYIWRGVGHKNQLGGGARNPFGVDFEANDKVWTQELCRKDSDGDGKTNGQELGDPDCIWTPGNEPSNIYGLSHPGICEPFNSTLCNGKPDYVECDYEDFECEHIDGDEDVFNFTVTMPETQVPATETTYICIAFEFPKDQADTYHIIANKPVIDNEIVMHHMIVTGICDGTPLEFNKPYPCGMGGNSPGRKFTCNDLVAGWTVGGPGQCIPPETGFLVGGATGYKYGIIQYHWNNPQELSNYKDSSGMTFYATPNLRQYNAGIFSIGQVMLEIPPGAERHEEHGLCSSVCTEKHMSGDINIFRAGNHMHYLGRAQITTLNKKDGNMVYIANDETYSYDSPVSHMHPEGILMRPGDELSTTCVFKSTSRSVTTFFGESTAEEMCLVYVAFYPKENFPKRNCPQFRSIDECQLSTGFVNGCDVKNLFDLTNPVSVQMFSRVQNYCSPGLCRVECLNYVRDLKKQPCFQGDVDKVMRHTAENQMPESVLWYAALDSCDVELLLERIDLIDDKTSSVATLVQSYTLVAFTVIVAKYLQR